MLRRTSVFAGGWTLRSRRACVQRRTAWTGEVMDLLTSLTDKNLVVPETQGDETRFGLLETVRHYAQDRLRESGEDEAVRDRHVELFLEMAGRLLDPTQNDSELRRSCFGSITSTTTCVPRWRGARPRRRVP